ncbi:hypothetical protein BU15DRAFT_80642 [Melanogaster broomeanus]|nr:hypothetical protein BU15DRAFT_80642 [Melanogaster broomeanus]
MQLGDFTAHIIVDEKELEEYDVVFDSETKATCWIASEEGKTFGIKWKCHALGNGQVVSARLTVDGTYCGGQQTNSRFQSVDNEHVISTVSSSTKTRDLMFSRLQLVDDDDLLHKEAPKDLGNISFTIRQGKLSRASVRTTRKEFPLTDDTLHERSKKATPPLALDLKETDNAPVPNSNLPSSPTNDPPLVFVFKYRPLGVLQANGIAPTPKSVSASSSSRHEAISIDCEVETQSDSYTEDVKPAELDNRIQSLENELRRLRSLQAGPSEDRKPERVKKEEPGLEKCPIFTPGEVIDLT